MDKNTLVNDIINDPLFDGYGQFIFPTGFNYPSSTMKISNINSLLPYHSHINTDTTIAVLEYFYQKAKNQVKYSIRYIPMNKLNKILVKKKPDYSFLKGEKMAQLLLLMLVVALFTLVRFMKVFLML